MRFEANARERATDGRAKNNSMELWVDLKLEPQGAAHAPRWWSDPSLVQATVDAIQQSGLWLGFERVGAAGGTASAPFSSGAELARGSTRWESGVYDLTGPAAEGASSLRLSLDPDELRVQLFVSGRDVDARRATLLGSVCDAIARVRTLLEGRVWVRTGNAVASGIELPRVRPLRLGHSLQPGTLLDVIDRDVYRELAARLPEDDWRFDFERAVNAPMPSGARRDERGPLIFLRWLDALVDDAAVVAAVVEQSRWVARELRTSLAPGWNQAGDRIEGAIQLAPHAPLAFYNARQRVGYQPVVALPDGSVDEDALAQAAEWRRQGLPDGTRIERLVLVVPKRAAAIALQPRAAALGIDQVLYSDSSGRWWNPFPSGWWVEE